MIKKKNNKKRSIKFNIFSGITPGFLTAIALLAIVFGGVMFLIFKTAPVNYISNNPNKGEEKVKEEEKKEELKVTHIEKPESVKAVYLSSWAGGSNSFRKRIIELFNTTEINSVVIDIKDYSGKLAFKTNSKYIKKVGSGENRIPDIKIFINKLHEMGIYVIGRVTVFQDPYFAKLNKDVAVLKESDGGLWADKKGLHYLDPGSRKVWNYIVEISKISYNLGFDEINFDYIRYPSDGDMKDIYFPITNERAKTIYPPKNATTTPIKYGKAEVLKEFFVYLNKELEGTGMITSADLFGMTTTNTDDLNIGQILEYTSPYFDYIAPMVYPSHYPPSFNGWANPNHYPYEVVRYSLDEGVKRLKTASTTSLKLRPWLQDFDYGGDYGPTEVRAQIKATYDAGLKSWMLWDPRNVYTKEALEEE